jgi:LPXTG-motif cell wall-anchored protein
MKFPNLSRRAQAVEPEKKQKENQKDPSTGSAWSTALLMVGSALVGATAVAVWNRRTITEMRNHLLLNSGQETPGRIEDRAPSAEDIF